MLKNYFTVAFRNLLRNKANSFLHITGLSIGMSVAMLIGLWIWDETTADRYNTHYDRIAQVMQNQYFNGSINTWSNLPYPVSAELRNKYGSDFRRVVLMTAATRVLTYQEKKLIEAGYYMEPEGPALLDLRFIQGGRSGLRDPYSVLLSRSAAQSFFGGTDPMNKAIRLDSATVVTVAGIYEDLPDNSAFAGTAFIMPWQLQLNTEKWISRMDNPWGSNFTHVYVELADHADLHKVSEKIRDVKLNNIRKNEGGHPQLFLQPMRDWRLYGEFQNGVNVGGRIEFVRLFGVIGFFVLLLACINFMNLSTAKSERRAREVGVRKVIGSRRGQLIAQFLSEAVFMALLAGLVAVVLTRLALPFFNTLADKKILFPWTHPAFWYSLAAFTLFTGLVAGSYPALYLSGFRPVDVLKGQLHPGRLASLPRKILVVLQFTVSMVLIIGTIVVFRQIQYARNRPAGYDRASLIIAYMHTRAVHNHLEAIRDDLKKSGAIEEMAESSAPVTDIWSSNGGLSWRGMAANLSNDFPMTQVSYDFGRTVGWQIIAGRDFSRDLSATDSSAFVINESAARFMGLQHPVGEMIYFNDGVGFKVIGVVKDLIMESPYAPVRPSLFRLARNGGSVVHVKLNPQISAEAALAKIGATFNRYNPEEPWDYHFVGEEYAKKFSDEQRIGNIATALAVLAVFISCLGLFGLASFIAEQRTREIGLRKVLGASVFQVWRLLSKDFAALVVISSLLAIPVGYYCMHRWLQQYVYHSSIPPWIFIVTAVGAMLITLLTISYQSLKAAVMNPVRSLRSE